MQTVQEEASTQAQEDITAKVQADAVTKAQADATAKAPKDAATQDGADGSASPVREVDSPPPSPSREGRMKHGHDSAR